MLIRLFFLKQSGGEHLLGEQRTDTISKIKFFQNFTNKCIYILDKPII